MDARTVANYMVYIMSDAFDDLTNMKMNKLLYFAQGHYLARYGRPLFDDRIEAWDHGPVVPSVYYAYKSFGDGPIKDYNPDIVDQITPEAEEILFGVARKYGGFTASYLRKMTQVVGAPCGQVYRRGCANVEIPLDSIRDYFSDLGNIEPATKKFKDSDFIGRRDEDGILVLPKEWDDEQV